MQATFVAYVRNQCFATSLTKNQYHVLLSSGRKWLTLHQIMIADATKNSMIVVNLYSG